MKSNFTIFITFFSNGDIRRKYIEIALNTLFEHADNKNIPIIVIDASSDEDFIKNKQLFSDMDGLLYIHDTEINPFKRCNKYLHLIKTDFVLRLLEDCAFINLSYNDFSLVEKDISLMKDVPKIDVIQYPIINEQEFKVQGNTVLYPAIDFEDKKLTNYNGYTYYDRSQERRICHYLCNNILYRTDFFKKHWEYITLNYSNNSSAEAGDIDNIVYKVLLKWRYSAKVARLFVRWMEKTIYSKSIINNIMVSETMLRADVVHIGYYSTEANINSSSVRENDANLDGVVSTISNLRVFNDIDLLNNIKFQRIKF